MAVTEIGSHVPILQRDPTLVAKYFCEQRSEDEIDPLLKGTAHEQPREFIQSEFKRLNAERSKTAGFSERVRPVIEDRQKRSR